MAVVFNPFTGKLDFTGGSVTQYWSRTGTVLTPTTSGDDVKMSGRHEYKNGGNASANAFGVLTITGGNVFTINSGANDLETIYAGTAGEDWQSGSMIILIFSATCYVAHDALDGDGAFAIWFNDLASHDMAIGDIMTLVFDGTYWRVENLNNLYGSDITSKTTATAVGTDYVLISDTSDAGAIKKALVSDFAGASAVDYNPSFLLGGM